MKSRNQKKRKKSKDQRLNNSSNKPKNKQIKNIRSNNKINNLWLQI